MVGVFTMREVVRDSDDGDDATLLLMTKKLYRICCAHVDRVTRHLLRCRLLWSYYQITPLRRHYVMATAAAAAVLICCYCGDSL